MTAITEADTGPLRVAITGATGFLGGALARALAGEGAEIRALRRASSAPDALSGLGVHWLEGDVTDRRAVDELVRGAGWVIHAAGRLGEANVPEADFRRVNVEGTRVVLEAALAAAPAPRVLHLSSPGVLGPTPRAPAPEDAPMRPGNPYERSKAEAEALALDFAARGVQVVVARPGFVYGPGDRHVLGLFRAVARGRFFTIAGGRALTQPTHVDDAAAGMLACLRRGRPGRTYHIVGPRAVTFRELVDTLAEALEVPRPRLDLPRPLAWAGAVGLEALGRALGRRPPLSRTGVDFFSADRVFDASRARDELGFTASRDIAEGVPATVAWYRARGWL